MKRSFLFVLVAAAAFAGCATAPSSDTDKQIQDLKVDEAIRELKATDPGIARFFETAVGYAVFPSVGKGGIGVGGAYGKGQVFERGVMIGWCDLTQATIGFQLGGQAYREVIFFQAQENLDKFTSGRFEFSAQASAVALTSGASANANYANGVAVFTLAEAGLMFEASIGGQKFDFVRK